MVLVVDHLMLPAVILLHLQYVIIQAVGVHQDK